MQKQYQLIAALLLTVGIGQAAQSVAISGALRGAVTLPAGAPFSAMANDMRAEMRVHGITLPSSGQVALVAMGNRPSDYARWGQFALKSTGDICFLNAIDTQNSYGALPACVALAGQTDVVLRLSRTVTGSSGLQTLEVWNSATGARSSNDGTNGGRILDTLNSLNMASLSVVFNSSDTYLHNNFSVNGGSASVAWFKWHSTSLGTNAAIPKQTDAADLLDLRFEGNGNDSSGRGLNMSFTGGTATYGSTPDLAPIALAKTASANSWTNWLSCRAMHPCQLSGLSSFSDALSFSYFWAQISGPSTGSWDSRTSGTPSVSGLVAGTYVFRLTVIDDVGLQDTDDLTMGVVATDANGVVITSVPAVKQVIGDLVRFGSSAWPYMDNRQKAFADWYGSRIQPTGDWNPSWRTFLPGTVSVSLNGLVVTGVGTNFSADMNCTGSDHDFMVIRYPDAGVTGGASPGFRYRFFYPNSCTATTATAVDAFNGQWDGPAVTGASYSKISTTEYYRWVGSGDSVNYYDNVLAHYAMYYRSGNTVYRDYARLLADNFIENPGTDYYREQGTGANPFQVAVPRARAAVGIMLRAIDGRPELWEYIWAYFNVTGVAGFPFELLQRDLRASTFFDRDMREHAYTMSFLAVAHMLWPSSDPNQVSRKAAIATVLNNAIIYQWTPLARPNGGQSNYAIDRLQGNGTSTAQVTFNNRVVTAVSGTFGAGICGVNGRPWFTTSYQHPILDTRSYTCVRNSDTQITLDVPYEGTTGIKSYSFEGRNSPNTQPFMMGLLANAMWHTWQATGNTAARQIILDVTGWLMTSGWRASVKGLYYDRDQVDCEPDPELDQGCIDSGDFSAQSNREYAAEVIGGMGRAYGIDPSISGLADRIDTHVGVLFGAAGFGGPQTSDGFVGAALGLPEAGTGISRLGKYHGFYFGFGADHTWDAARIGGVTATDERTVTMTLALPSGVTAATVTYTAPSSATSVVTCSVASQVATCLLPTDWRQGNYLWQPGYTRANGSWSGDALPLSLQ